MSSNFLQLIRLKRTSPTTFVSLSMSERMGNLAPFAFGGQMELDSKIRVRCLRPDPAGCVLALAVNAAHLNLPQSPAAPLAIYSMLGHFLGPNKTDRHVKLVVEDVRTTRTFATRRVVVSQVQDDGSERSTLAVTLDFMATSPSSVLQYSTIAPSLPHHSTVEPYLDSLDTRVAAGKLPATVASSFKTLFGLMYKMMDVKMPDQSAFGQNAWGLAKHEATSQDGLPLTSKRSAHWLRCKMDLAAPPLPSTGEDAEPISSQAANASMAAFALDYALAFIPLSFSNQFLSDVGACSTLDFALRFHSDVLDMRQWHIEEIRTVAGDHGRTYSEGALWGEDGKLVATMTQQSVLRPLPDQIESKL